MVSFHAVPEATPPLPESLTLAAHKVYEEWRRTNAPVAHVEAVARANNDARRVKEVADARDRETYPDHDTSGSPYRSPAPRPEPDALPWRVTRWQKLYVRVARALFDVRASYREGRAWRKYRRDLTNWHEANPRVDGRLPRKAPPMPCPPPAYVWE